MEILEDWIHDCLTSNPTNFNNGLGFFLKEDIPEDTIKAIKKRHDERVSKGHPYYILDFILEDLENGKEIRVQDDGFYPKDVKPKYAPYQEGKIIKMSHDGKVIEVSKPTT